MYEICLLWHMEKTECLGCGSQEAIIAFEVKYRGFRGTCEECGANWPES